MVCILSKRGSVLIYAIQCGLASIKFGKAKNPEQRMADLQVGCPWQLALVASVDWHDENEKLIHACFADERIRGEWYEITERVDNFLMILASDETDEVKFSIAMSFIQEEYECGRAPLVEEFKRRRCDRPQADVAVRNDEGDDAENQGAGRGVVVEGRFDRRPKVQGGEVYGRHDGAGGDSGHLGSKQRWSRESYNAYQREYMRKKRLK